jgi:hypothetical protein
MSSGTYNGRIELGRELSFTQAQQLRSYFIQFKSGLEISSDGRALQWNRKDPEQNIEVTLTHIIESYLSKWGIISCGVITAVWPEKVNYDIIVVGNRVKLFRDGNITTVKI